METTILPNQCKKCKRVFKQKSHLTAHEKKKISCDGKTVQEQVKEQIEQQVEIEVSKRLRPKDEKIKTKEQVQELYHQLHHLLWSDEGVSPEQFNEKLNFFFFLKAIEPQIVCKNLVFVDEETSQKCRFSYLAEIEDEHELYDIFTNVVIQQIYKHPETKEYFKAIKINRSKNLFAIIQEINRIDIYSEDYDFLGDLYEYCIGRGTSQMSDDGQYYTNRPVCNIIVRHLNPQIDNDSKQRQEIPSMIDPFCGTGGMNISYVNYINQQIVDKEDPYKYTKIKELWTKNRKTIFGSDISSLNVMSTKMNLLFHTGVTFTKDNFRQANSFKDTLFYEKDGQTRKKYNYIMTNSPFGGDKTKGEKFRFKYGEYENGKKSGNYIHEVSEDIKSIDIRVNDKVPTAVQLCMSLLEVHGGCGMVLPDGFFFNTSKAMVKTRSYLIDNFNVTKVIDIPQGAFENTTTKTSIVIFYKPVDKSGATKEIEFINFEKPANKLHVKDLPFEEFIEVSKCKVQVSEIRNKKYYLKFNRYLKPVIDPSSQYKEYKLGDLFEISKGKFNSKQGKEEGVFDFYTGSANNPNGKIDESNCSGESIILTSDGGSGSNKYGDQIGLGCVYYTTQSVGVSNANMILKQKSDVFLMKYLYYILKNRKNEIMDIANYTTGLGHITMDELKDLTVSIPSIALQKQYLDKIDSNQQLISSMETVYSKMQTCLKYKAQKLCEENSCTTKKFKDIFVFEKRTTHLASEGNKKGKYRFYCSSQEKMMFTDTCDYIDYKIIIGTGGKGSLHLDHHFGASCTNCILDTKTEYLPFLYFYLVGNRSLLENGFNATTMPHMTKEYLEEIEIPVPDINVQRLVQQEFEYLQNTKQMLNQLLEEKEKCIRSCLASKENFYKEESKPLSPSPLPSPSSRDSITTYTEEELKLKSMIKLKVIAKQLKIKDFLKIEDKDQLVELILKK